VSLFVICRSAPADGGLFSGNLRRNRAGWLAYMYILGCVAPEKNAVLEDYSVRFRPVFSAAI
jgi:hypothetical protein